jgi:cytochrome c
MTRRVLAIVAALALAGCGKGEPARPAAAAPAAAGAGDLTPFEQEHGIGPVKEVVVLGALDRSLADSGGKVFAAKCTACHKLGEKYIGPALGEVLTRRSPTYVMNMILNPQEMVERHPVAKQLLAEHMTFMANQGLNVGEARAVVEYFRTQAKGSVKSQ